jgi:hypothetical protein
MLAALSILQVPAELHIVDFVIIKPPGFECHLEQVREYAFA